MDVVQLFLDLFLHLDTHLAWFMSRYGAWTYAMLFLIIFCETGLVVTPLLPGDSLLFAAGALAAGGELGVHGLVVLLIVAAVAGDSLNYTAGRWAGPKVLRSRSRFLNQTHLERARAFYETRGGKTIILSRFIPIIRTYAPFVAGVAKMQYRRFLFYNVVGGIVWVTLFVYAGYFFGTLPAIKQHVSLVALGIIVVSLLPLGVRYVRRQVKSMRVAPGSLG